MFLTPTYEISEISWKSVEETINTMYDTLLNKVKDESKVYIEDNDILGQNDHFANSPNLQKIKILELGKVFN